MSEWSVSGLSDHPTILTHKNLNKKKKKKNLFAVNNDNNACSCSAQLIRRATREAVAHQMLAALVTQYSILGLYYNRTDDR